MRRNVLALILFLLLPHAVHADRITQMTQSDLCIYTAKLQVAGYYYFEQGKPREEVKIVWHGDETQNEIDFVNRTLDDAYLWSACKAAAQHDQSVAEGTMSSIISGRQAPRGPAGQEQAKNKTPAQGPRMARGDWRYQ